MNSVFGKLNLNDFLKGFVVASLTSILNGLVVVIGGGSLPTLAQLQSIAMVGLSAGIAYLAKNLVTNTNGEMLKKDQQ